MDKNTFDRALRSVTKNIYILPDERDYINTGLDTSMREKKNIKYKKVKLIL